METNYSGSARIAMQLVDTRPCTIDTLVRWYDRKANPTTADGIDTEGFPTLNTDTGLHELDLTVYFQGFENTIGNQWVDVLGWLEATPAPGVDRVDIVDETEPAR